MADSARLEAYVGSLTRCLGLPAFLDRFYEIFLESSPEVAEKFKHTNFARQKVALGQSLYLMVMAAEGGEAAVAYLDRIAERHARGALDIRPELYDVWLDALIATARELDSEFDDETEAVWREMIRPGIEIMRARYLPSP
jgi:hemoglobin-like flavoprotein